MTQLQHVDTPSFDITVTRAATPVLVDFFADWCGPCRALAPTLEEVAAEHEGALSVVKVDIDDNPELATRYGVEKIPTLILFDGGEAQAQVTGVISKAELEKRLQPFIAAAPSAVN